MKTLVVYYSKTGTTETVAKTIIEGGDCDFDVLRFDEKAKTLNYTRDPSAYEYVILLSPVWAFALAEPMKQYVAKQKANIKRYDLIVTCSGLGLWGCVKNCVSAIGRPPEHALKLRSAQVKRGDFDVGMITQAMAEKPSTPV